MIRMFKQTCPTISPISTKRILISYLKSLFGTARKCGRVKPVKGITTLPPPLENYTDINKPIKKNLHRFVSTQKDRILSQLNDNKDMDSTIAGSMADY
jgi:hypothetical protein